MTSSFAFFGVQLAIPQRNSVWDEGQSAQTEPLHQLIGERAESQRLHEKRRFWKALSKLAGEAVVPGARGHWDLIRDSKAEREFETWSAEIEGHALSSAEHQGAIPRPAGDATRRGEPTFALLSVIFLVTAGSPADNTLGALCDHEEDRWLTRHVFQVLLRGIPRLDLGYVQADAAYLEPGTATMGLPLSVLEGEGYEYLKLLR